MTRIRSAAISALLCGALAGVYPAAPLQAAPQDQSADASSLARLKQRLDKPAAPLNPSGKLELRPTFRSSVEKNPFVPTLEEHLRKTFELTDFQRKYAAYTAANGGFDLSLLFRPIDKALEERRIRNIRAQIRRELADIDAARAAQNR